MLAGIHRDGEIGHVPAGAQADADVRADQVEGGAPRRDPGRPADHHGRGQPSAGRRPPVELVALLAAPGRRVCDMAGAPQDKSSTGVSDRRSP